MPQGGIVTTYSDITERVAASEALARANETLERRVRERTAELTEVNEALAVAKRKADEANLDKTRFLAAASHDVLQPLNAARLYATSLVERQIGGPEAKLARNIDASLEAVEEILNVLIEISRLDAGRLEPDITAFPLSEVFERLEVEFQPLAREKGLELRIVPTRLWVRSDRRLLRRVLQNLALQRHQVHGGGQGAARRAAARRHDHRRRCTTPGPASPARKRVIIFKEFQRLEETAQLGARASGSASPSSSASARCSGTASSCIRCLAAARCSPSTCRARIAMSPAEPSAGRRARRRGGSRR